MLGFHPERRDVLGPGRVIRVVATDVPDDDPDATWRVDLTGDAPRTRPGPDAPGDEPAAVSAHGLLVDVLAVLYRRREPDVLDVVGDRALLADWLAVNGFA